MAFGPGLSLVHGTLVEPFHIQTLDMGCSYQHSGHSIPTAGAHKRPFPDGIWMGSLVHWNLERQRRKYIYFEILSPLTVMYILDQP